MKSLRIVLAIVEWVFAASSLFATDYSWPTTDYGGLASTDYSWPELERATVKESSIAENLPADAQSTPHDEVHRILQWFQLTPKATLVEYGCGYDARFCIAASSAYGCKSIGVEIDHGRAESARRLVRSLGLSHLVEIIEGDATKLNIEADYGVAYLWPETLAGIRQHVLELTAFASFSHEVPGLPMKKSGDSFFWNSATHWEREVAQSNPVGHWGGVAYSGRVCSNPNCTMCNSIQQQIENVKRSQAILETPVVAQAAKDEKRPGVNGNWFNIKYCNGRQCWYQTEWRWF